ncbi:MAG: WD40 repeat domain-containing protein [Promethearchaeota archaeon]
MSNLFILERMEEPESEVESIALTPDGTYLFVGTLGGYLSGYWVRSYAPCMGESGYDYKGLLSLSSSPDSQYLVGGSTDGKVLIWKHKVVGNLRTVGEHLGPVNSVLFSPDGKIIYSAGGKGDNIIKKWDAKNLALITNLAELEDEINAIAISSDGKILYAGAGNKLYVFDTSDGFLKEKKIAHEAKINDIAISNDDELIITGSLDKTVKIWNSRSYAQLEVFVDPDSEVKSVANCKDGKYISCGTSNGIIYIWELEYSGKLLQKLKVHEGPINNLAFTINGDALISGSSDKTLIAWNFELILQKEKERIAEEEKILREEMEIRVREEEEEEKKIKAEEEKKLKKIKEQKRLKEAEVKRLKELEEQKRIEEAQKLIIENELPMDDKKQNLLLEISKQFQDVGELIRVQKFEEALELSIKISKIVNEKKLEDFITPSNNLIQSIKLLLNNLDITKVDTDVSKMSKLEIPKDKLNYDKKEKRLSIDILDFTFLGQYYTSTILSEILDHFHASLSHLSYERKNIIVIDPITNSPIPENSKVKDLNLLPKLKEKEEEDTEEKLQKSKLSINVEAPIDYPTAIGPEDEEDSEIKLEEAPKEMMMAELLKAPTHPKKEYKTVMKQERQKKITPTKSKKKMAVRSGPPHIPPAAMAPSSPGGPPPYVGSPAMRRDITAIKSPIGIGELADDMEGPEEKTHDINMGLQYYAVMMEKQTYLFYIYLSHKELVIQDEEGKTVYETTFQIVTTTPEPPRLDLRIEGEGFEVHPIRCVMEVDEDAVSQPVMIFSITALPKIELSEKERKKGYRRFLNIIIEFEEKKVSHTIMSVIIQTKHISMKLGPIQLSLSKAQAMAVCLLSISITAASSIYTLLTMDFSSAGSSGGNLEGIIPGAGSLVFMLSFIMTILKKGVFPIKKKVAGMLDFTQAAAMMK